MEYITAFYVIAQSIHVYRGDIRQVLRIYAQDCRISSNRSIKHVLNRSKWATHEYLLKRVQGFYEQKYCNGRYLEAYMYKM